MADQEINNPAVTAAVDPVADEERARSHGWTEKSAINYESYQPSARDDAHWLANSRVYEWSDEYGDVGPEVPDLEAKLFNGEFIMRLGQHSQALEFEVDVRGPVRPQPIRRFDDAGLHPIVLSNVKKCGYAAPLPIQAYVVPLVNMGHDVVAISQTGEQSTRSGKTGAFLIPIISKLMGKAKKLTAWRPLKGDPSYGVRRVRAEPLVVILVPTRELALQIYNEACRLCYRSMLRPGAVYGGCPMPKCLEELGKGCDILVATPGRLLDMMSRPDVLTMSRVKYTVLDEADELLHTDWTEELEMIIKGGDTNEDADHVYMMFSATFPKEIRRLARQYMSDDAYQIRVGRPGQSHKNIAQDILLVDRDRKDEATYDLLTSMKPCRTLIFCNSRRTVDLLDGYLYNRGLPVTSIHGDRNQREREDSLRAFRTGKAPILVATGVSARGWDVAGVEHVINYDLPSAMHGGITEYTHRIGRTGRVGNRGMATSFYNERDEDLAQDLVNCLVECGCAVPEFLSHLSPEDGKIDFQDDTDPESEDGEANTNGFGDGEEAEAGFSAEPTPFVADTAADPNVDW